MHVSTQTTSMILFSQVCSHTSTWSGTSTCSTEQAMSEIFKTESRRLVLANNVRRVDNRFRLCVACFLRREWPPIKFQMISRHSGLVRIWNGESVKTIGQWCAGSKMLHRVVTNRLHHVILQSHAQMRGSYIPSIRFFTNSAFEEATPAAWFTAQPGRPPSGRIASLSRGLYFTSTTRSWLRCLPLTRGLSGLSDSA